ncbi:MAG TPA: cytochrome C oxidase subunit IV family protein [Polyangia bacterium]|nr:cytochrome C oxidase subunit IV family protein [Polyangia bacterium]
MANPTNNEAPHAAEHAHGVGRYFAVWIALMAFTVITVITGHQEWGSVNLPLAVSIATIKATLVVLFFMHMTEAPAANRIVFVVSIFFAILLIIGVFGDLWTRNEMTLPSAAPSTEGPEISVPSERLGAPSVPDSE